MILDQIVSDKKEEIAHRKRRVSLAEFRTRAESVAPARNLADVLRRTRRVKLIAEIKRASPSRGELSADANPHRVAQKYAANGAAAISVLTDKKYFHGTPNDLKEVRVAVDIPILRKDFIIDEYQVYESRALQSDAILLIVRIITDQQLRDYLALAQSLSMHALVEIHDEADLDRAVNANSTIIGINNRNLADFAVNLATTERLAPRIPKEKIVVAESGVSTRADVQRCARVGASGVLVGEALMKAQDVGAKVRELAEVPIWER